MTNSANIDSIRVTYPPFNLPSGRKVQFKVLSYKERRSLVQSFKNDSGCLLEEWFAAYCLVKVDDTPVAKDWEINSNWPERMAGWTSKDVMFYCRVFADTEMLSEQGDQEAREVAKKLLGEESKREEKSAQELEEVPSQISDLITSSPPGSTQNKRRNLKVNTTGA